MTFLGYSEAQIIELLWFVAVFAIFSMSLNLVVGQAGLFQLGQVGFFAIGGIAAVVATHADHWGLELFAGILLASGAAIVAALVLAVPTLHLRGDYFAIVTLGFGVGVEVVLRGFFVQGVFNVPRLEPWGVPLPEGFTVFGRAFGRPHVELVVVAAVACAVYFLLARLVRSPFGRALRAIREDEFAAQALGKDVVGVKLKAFVLSAVLAAFAGVLYVHHLRVFDPSFYGFKLTITVLVMVILGGLGSNQGAVLGTFLIVAIDEVAKRLTRDLDTGFDVAALNIMIFAALLVALMVWRPQGILGDREYDVRSAIAALARRVRGKGGGA